MQKNLEYKHSVRATIGANHIGWINTDDSIALDKDVKEILPNHQDQVEALLRGEITEVDETKPTKRFYLGTKETPTKPRKFLGYLETQAPSTPAVIDNIWGKLKFTPREK